MDQKSGTESTATPPSPPTSDSRVDGSSGPPSEGERRMLLILQELINRRLETAPPSAQEHSQETDAEAGPDPS